jgi:hypothetical protein
VALDELHVSRVAESLDRDAGKVRGRGRVVVDHEKRRVGHEPAITREANGSREGAKAAFQQRELRLVGDDGDGEPGGDQNGWRVIAFVPETPSTVYENVPLFASLNDRVMLPTWRTFTLDALNVALDAAGPDVA